MTWRLVNRSDAALLCTKDKTRKLKVKNSRFTQNLNKKNLKNKDSEN